MRTSVRTWERQAVMTWANEHMLCQHTHQCDYKFVRICSCKATGMKSEWAITVRPGLPVIALQTYTHNNFICIKCNKNNLNSTWDWVAHVTHSHTPCIVWSHTHKRYPQLLDSPAEVRDGPACLARNAARSSGSEIHGRNHLLVWENTLKLIHFLKQKILKRFIHLKHHSKFHIIKFFLY